MLLRVRGCRTGAVFSPLGPRGPSLWFAPNRGLNGTSRIPSSPLACPLRESSGAGCLVAPYAIAPTGHVEIHPFTRLELSAQMDDAVVLEAFRSRWTRCAEPPHLAEWRELSTRA